MTEGRITIEASFELHLPFEGLRSATKQQPDSTATPPSPCGSNTAAEQDGRRATTDTHSSRAVWEIGCASQQGRATREGSGKRTTCFYMPKQLMPVPYYAATTPNQSHEHSAQCPFTLSSSFAAILPCASGALSGAPFNACCWALRSGVSSKLCVFDRLGLKGAGELGLDDRNCKEQVSHCDEFIRMED